VASSYFDPDRHYPPPRFVRQRRLPYAGQLAAEWILPFKSGSASRFGWQEASTAIVRNKLPSDPLGRVSISCLNLGLKVQANVRAVTPSGQ
jgi:hypothetical protein